MIPEIRSISPKMIVGIRRTMSLADHQVAALWRAFMPRHREIQHALSNDLLSVECYQKVMSLHEFLPTTKFEKWAAKEVTDLSSIPEGMESMTIEGGFYAVFLYRGRSSEYATFFRYIFAEWLPSSGYVLDHKAHFEVMGPRYLHDHPDSEEEIWVPVRLVEI